MRKKGKDSDQFLQRVLRSEIGEEKLNKAFQNQLNMRNMKD